ncbi:MAG: hypothetical protein ABIJ27_06100 [Candidatus Omnitrophota bacterium]
MARKKRFLRRNWKTIREFETKLKKSSLPCLTESGGFRTAAELYQAIIPNTTQRDLRKVRADHISTLSAVHRLFNKVTA